MQWPGWERDFRIFELKRLESRQLILLDSEYRIAASDLPTCITSISIDEHSMPVLDYGGQQVGMPVSVREVEQAIELFYRTDSHVFCIEDKTRL
jgi:hypothetical protein